MLRFLLAMCLVPAAFCQADATREDWPHYNGQPSAWRYSALDQVNVHNVKRLVPVWVFQTGDYEGGLQATPIVVDGVMYLSTSHNRVYAIDAVTGRELWQYVYDYPKDMTTAYGPWNRGVAVSQGRVFMGTIDNHVVALEQRNGRELWKVNVEDFKQCGCNITGAPLVVKDKVIVGVTAGDSAHRGYLNAFDVKTGRHVWRFWTIPGPGEKGHESWAGDSWKYGGGSTWMTGSYDPDLDLVYWSVGNPAADFYGGDRKGDNLYTDSVIALDPDTGKLKWHHQQIPHDVWDFDTAYENVLLDLPVNGKPRKVLLNVNKGGYTFVVDRTNGEFITAWPVARNINWISGISPKGELLGRNEPELGKPKVLCPSIGGGRQWNQATYSPLTGWFYSTGIEWCQEVVARKEEPEEGKVYFGGEFKLVPPIHGKPGGHLSAFDPLSGKRMWTYEYKYPLLAAAVSTAGDLVFTGDAEGRFFALHARTGARLWSFQTGSGHRGGPITYSVRGKQFVATPSGWGSAVIGLLPQLWPETEKFRGGSAMFVFALAEEGRW
jgi:alcohol dehydrogenase (cytochrome c)